MRTMRSISQILMVIAIGLFLFDAVYQWIAIARFKIRTVEELWSDFSRPGFEHARAAFQSVIPPNGWDSFAHFPAPAVIAIAAVFFYALFRFLAFLSGAGKDSRL